MAGNFLVSPKMGSYFCRFDGDTTICVLIPSMAERFSYRIADRLAYTLRSKGFVGAHVSDLSGMPATPESIANAEAQAAEFTITFVGLENKEYFFAGLDGSGQPQGTPDRSKAKGVSKAAANEVYARLKKMGFKEAKVVEFANESEFEDELKSLLGTIPDLDKLKFKDVPPTVAK